MRQVNVGGLSTGAARPLTGELQRFADSATNGLLRHGIDVIKLSKTLRTLKRVLCTNKKTGKR